MSKVYPWDYHPDLTAERIAAVAALIADGRQAAVERFDREAGDNAWTHGVSAFQFGRHRILRAIDSGEHPWLTAIDRNLQLIFKIGQVPVRFYKGEADEPTDRTLRKSFSELRQLSLLFDEHDEGRDLAYRFAIEPDANGDVLAITFVGLRGETAILHWDVPFADHLAAGTVGRAAAESVELPAPRVGVRGANKKRDSSET